MFNKLFTCFPPKSSQEAVVPNTTVLVYAPISGQMMPLEGVADPVFAQKMLGDGMAIQPVSSQVLAPFDGTVIATFPTGHAIGLRSITGLECLIHVGIDTVTLKGQGFRLLVSQDQSVKQGTPLIDLDLSVLQSSGKDLVTPLVITNNSDWQIEQRWDKATIIAGKQLLFIARPNSSR
jgi:glucose-specific phosphotransferase system IIA component